MSAAGGFSAFQGFVGDILGFASSLTSSAYQKNQVKLQQKQLQLDMEAAYRSSLDTLMQLGTAYNDTKLQITAAQSQLASADEWLDRYDEYYATQIGQTIESGMGQFQTLMQNWQNQGVITAERGQTGSTANLLSAIQKQSLINYVGEDLSLDANGGTFGGALREQILDFEADKQSVINSQKIITEGITALEEARDSYYNSFRDTLKATVEQGHAIGQTYADLSKRIDEYRDYLDASDEEYNRIKAQLLEEWKPLDFEIKTTTETISRGGDESEHGSNDFDVTTYKILDKATGKEATQEQVENLLRNYAGNLKEKDWYGNKNYRLNRGYQNSYGLSEAAIKAIMKNSNYNKRKDYK